jgi:hypothetical protein
LRELGRSHGWILGDRFVSSISKRCSPSPRPSPSGGGRIVRRLTTRLTSLFAERRLTGFAASASENHEASACGSLSPRERVRVRGNRGALVSWRVAFPASSLCLHCEI